MSAKFLFNNSEKYIFSYKYAFILFCVKGNVKKKFFRCSLIFFVFFLFSYWQRRRIVVKCLWKNSFIMVKEQYKEKLFK